MNSVHRLANVKPSLRFWVNDAVPPPTRRLWKAGALWRAIWGRGHGPRMSTSLDPLLGVYPDEATGGWSRWSLQGVVSLNIAWDPTRGSGCVGVRGPGRRRVILAGGEGTVNLSVGDFWPQAPVTKMHTYSTHTRHLYPVSVITV